MTKIKLECETDYHKVAQDYLKGRDYTAIYLLHQAVSGIKYELIKNKGCAKLQGICRNADDQINWRLSQAPDYFSGHSPDARVILKVLMRLWLASKLGIKNLDCKLLATCYPVEAATINARLRKVTSQSNILKLHHECGDLFRNAGRVNTLWDNTFRNDLLEFLISITAYYKPSWADSTKLATVAEGDSGDRDNKAVD